MPRRALLMPPIFLPDPPRARNFLRRCDSERHALVHELTTALDLHVNVFGEIAQKRLGFLVNEGDAPASCPILGAMKDVELVGGPYDGALAETAATLHEGDWIVVENDHASGAIYTMHGNVLLYDSEKTFGNHRL